MCNIDHMLNETFILHVKTPQELSSNPRIAMHTTDFQWYAYNKFFTSG